MATASRDILEGKWKQLRGNIRQRWGNVTEDDLQKIRGRYEQLSGLLQEKYGYNRKRAEGEIDSFLEGLSDVSGRVRRRAGEATVRVSDKSWQVLGLAILIGFAIAMWLKLNSDRATPASSA